MRLRVSKLGKETNRRRPVNLAPCMNHLAIEIIGKGLFGVDLEERAEELESSLQILLRGVSGVFRVPGTSILLP